MFTKFIGKNSLIAVLAIVLVSCGGPEFNSEKSPVVPQVIGHGGMGFSSVINPFNPLPDNSMRAIVKAIELGADGVEVDVQMSKDSVLILYHDKELDSKTKGRGCIGNTSSDSIIGLQYLSDFPFNLLHEEVVITLDSLIESFKKRNVFPHIYLDIHSFNHCAPDGGGYRDINQFVRSLARVIKRSGAPMDRIHPTSSYTVLLDSLTKLLPETPMYYEEHSDYQTGIDVVSTHGYAGLVLKRQIIPSTAVREEARKKGIKIIYFGGKSSVTIREMLQSYPDAIQVNNVEAMREILDNG